jgi:uncharacterized cupredoxin-like copper-binding protein
VSRRALGVALVVVGSLGLVGVGAAFMVHARTDPAPVFARWPMSGVGPGNVRCEPGALPGSVVDVVLSDMPGGMMTGGRMMRVSVDPSSVPAGDVSFRVVNAGMMAHELVVLPLPASGAGTRAVGADGRVDETASVGEASRSCGEGEGDGIAPGATGWVTLQLDPGRYELLCNLPGHYAAGMYAELAVT